ncbi:MAG: formate--tetrahydrofolate ligase [Candidatus Omnitrophica bacterium]|nr:formate--tetrahydrofolate ligase [Candidatus Omnitrophota bacterium]
MKTKQISEIAKKLKLKREDYLPYGDYKAKIKLSALDRFRAKKDGKLIFVTSINPTPSGEGKTTTSIGLTQSLNAMGKKTLLCLRQPSLGPVFGRKGGAAGGGKAALYPFSDINLHFTGDFHAISIAHNMLAAVVDNHIYWGNRLKIKDILWERVIDINDRTLRSIKIGRCLSRKDYPRDSSFKITSVSELMAILALFQNRLDIEKMIGNILIGYNNWDEPVYAKELNVVPAISLLLKDAMMPNLVQTLNADPVLVHTGPFANIAHGNSSLVATKMALKLSDFVVTEGGFGSDLGFEKFINIVARKGGFKISAVVLVVSLRALKYHGGIKLSAVESENMAGLKKGLPNLKHHFETIGKFGFDAVICINRFNSDTEPEIEYLKNYCSDVLGARCSVSEVYNKGSRGGYDLAEQVIDAVNSNDSAGKALYKSDESIKNKIGRIAKEVYGAAGVEYSPEAEIKIRKLKKLNLDKLPINIAKTQFSLTHDPKRKGVPENWRLFIKDILIASGAGFIIPVTGEMLLLPGLPQHPVLEEISFSKGEYVGLF